MPSRHSNGTIPTPHRPDYDVTPHPANLSPPVTDELHLGPLMESPGRIDDQGGILLHPDTDRDQAIEDESEAIDHVTSGHERHPSEAVTHREPGTGTGEFPRIQTIEFVNTPHLPSHQSGYGGFPMPHELAGRFIKRVFPQTMTLTRRNSQFHDLTQEEQEELGGVEYRALGALLWIIAAYHIGIQLFGFVVFAPYSSMPKWAPVFREQQHRFVPPTWFSAFQAVSAYTNTGMSLIDQSMIPFQTAYPMIIITFFMILAGNTAFPICLRFFIWLLSKVVGKRSHETLSFLLDHPRRCFIYLFPSHQTWFLLIVLVTMVITDWVSFMVLDIGNEVFEAIPVGTRIAIGLLQAGAVRAAGFATISLSALAPAVKVLYVTMMYVAVYPIALSVRATNVYEEQSLGVYLDGEGDEEEPNGPSSVSAWGSYLAWHARRQLSFDMWWLAVALWLLCIIERGEIMNPESEHWFDIFTIIFELVSAYGTVGLSLGLPTANYSFSGALRPLSKLVICLVMLRGRHRGLPHAIDRAVVLPWELMGRQGQNRSYSGLDTLGNRQSMAGEPGSSLEGHSTSRAPTATHGGVDLKHRTNTILSPVHEVLTPVTSVTGTPRATFSALGPGEN
ncbi:Low-affinity potassium transport protein [Rhizoctonia solani AG-1 IB]|uniref:Low-affinity potassium transport protein n=2 Tax=Thanatephorus cucumeris (strain AG1-IB / isolate 7/3/14) TaxID=1108050 RepID=M5C2M0_THACB|nr:Low-affinity potassium transport protein [Rhizoctonia solani AG-1 IB]